MRGGGPAGAGTQLPPRQPAQWPGPPATASRAPEMATVPSARSGLCLKDLSFFKKPHPSGVAAVRPNPQTESHLSLSRVGSAPGTAATALWRASGRGLPVGGNHSARCSSRRRALHTPTTGVLFCSLQKTSARGPRVGVPGWIARLRNTG